MAKREEIDITKLEGVNGGSVIMSEGLRICGFNTTGESFRIVGDFKTMRNTLIDLYDNNAGMSDAEFDQLVKNIFLANGWID